MVSVRKHSCFNLQQAYTKTAKWLSYATKIHTVWLCPRRRIVFLPSSAWFDSFCWSWKVGKVMMVSSWRSTWRSLADASFIPPRFKIVSHAMIRNGHIAGIVCWGGIFPTQTLRVLEITDQRCHGGEDRLSPLIRFARRSLRRFMMNINNPRISRIRGKLNLIRYTPLCRGHGPLHHRRASPLLLSSNAFMIRWKYPRYKLVRLSTSHTPQVGPSHMGIERGDNSQTQWRINAGEVIYAII